MPTFQDPSGLTKQGHANYIPLTIATKFAEIANQSNAFLCFRYPGNASVKRYEQLRGLTPEERANAIELLELPGAQFTQEELQTLYADRFYGKPLIVKAKTGAAPDLESVENLLKISTLVDIAGYVPTKQETAKLGGNQKNIDTLLADISIGLTTINQTLQPVESTISNHHSISERRKRSLTDITPDKIKRVSFHHAARDGLKEYVLYEVPASEGGKRFAYLRKDEKGHYHEAIHVSRDQDHLSRTYHIDEVQLELSEETLAKLSPKEILATQDKKMIIGDWDPAWIATAESVVLPDAAHDRGQHGIVSDKEYEIVTALEQSTNGMVRHGGENRNPYTTGLAVSEDDPIIVVSPTGELKALKSTQEIITEFNTQENQGYHSYIPPAWRITRNKEGKLVENTHPFDYDEVHAKIQNIKDPAQKELAKSIFNLRLKEDIMRVNETDPDVANQGIAFSRVIRDSLEKEYIQQQLRQKHTSFSFSPVHLYEKSNADTAETAVRTEERTAIREQELGQLSPQTEIQGQEQPNARNNHCNTK